jgi:MBG domain
VCIRASRFKAEPHKATTPSKTLIEKKGLTRGGSFASKTDSHILAKSTIEPVLVGTYAVVATINDARYHGTQTGSMVISAVASSPALLTTTIVITNIGNGYQMAVMEKNSGGTAAANLQVTGAILGAATGTPVPASFGNIAAGGSANVLLNFPALAGASGAVVVAKVNGSYTGGYIRQFSPHCAPGPLP